MSRIEIEFSTDNDAFARDFDHELYFILSQANKKLRSPEDAEYKLKDTNGNTIGTAKKIMEE